MADVDNLRVALAAAYVRGVLPWLEPGLSDEALILNGRASGLKLHRFKRTLELPRVRAVIGVLRALEPASLLDIGTGRGVFLWPLLEAFPDLSVTAVEPDERRRGHLEAVSRGGFHRLAVVGADASRLDFADRSFDVVTALEVLEHQRDPGPMAREAIRIARRFVIASVPSKADDDPEHVQLFTRVSLEALLKGAGAASVRIEHVLNHTIAVARIDRA
jgi:ubiquinone/menaquinone biosynthesis C-methylase UbiE